MANKKDLIERMNKALALEYAAAVQYIQHAAVMTGAQYADIAKELDVHANEEIAHAIKLADLITDLDGMPTVDVEKRFVSDDAVKMLEQDLTGEQIAIDGYKELVKMAYELNEHGIRAVLEGILANEEEHKRDLLRALGR